MADPEKQNPPEPAPAQTQSAGGITLNVSYVKSPRGIIKIVEIFLLMIAFSCLADICVNCTGRYSFFLFSTIFPWILCIIIFVLYLFCLVEKIPQINWTLTVMINAILWALVILTSSSLVADDIRKRKEYSRGYYVVFIPDNLYAAVVFGFLSVVAFVVDAIFHFQHYRS
ncbi:plasmolipin-like [Actinia tenebrosa]|uniref:Plasmolipin-like n=1 Tax=Actinia tenebrosa TaxID=6105 RepID=A0A6P8IVF3_ACTTE|nr:plasmolipin-like [Actinia tenebrosa]